MTLSRACPTCACQKQYRGAAALRAGARVSMPCVTQTNQHLNALPRWPFLRHIVWSLIISCHHRRACGLNWSQRHVKHVATHIQPSFRKHACLHAILVQQRRKYVQNICLLFGVLQMQEHVSSTSAIWGARVTEGATLETFGQLDHRHG
jgi:hypothetical protein